MDNLLIYDLVFLVLFTLFIVWFLYTHRKNLKREGILYLYRTKFGMRAIEWTSKKFKNQLRWLQYVSIATGYILMGSMLFLFFQLVYIYIRYPETVRAIKIPPIMPLIPYLPSIFKLDFLPPFYFAYWIIILAVVAIGHEFAHGIFARLHNIKIKSTGFGFLGPFLAAFVEPDDKQMQKKPIKQQLAVLSAGTFANIVMSIFFIIIFILFFYAMFMPAGALFNSYSFTEINLTKIDSINGNKIINPQPQDILKNLNLNSTNNLTKVKIGNDSYLINNVIFTTNFKDMPQKVIVYNDFPAVNAGVIGAIIGINNDKITNWEDFKEVISKYSPGDNVTIKTKASNNKIHEYNITLSKNSEGKPAIGVGILEPSTSGVKGFLYKVISKFKDPFTYYEPRFDGDLVEFFSDMIWWMILINISVALVNMLPLGIFDGGRVFYLTILFFTKSEDKAQKAFKWITMFLLFLVGVLMLFWFYSFLSA
ncbi:MAG: site-2 protease family protein [Candidatus Pacearchaeota archaeon]|jgi:membrane-associated protease RseP (regulator of RpoE activity)